MSKNEAPLKTVLRVKSDRWVFSRDHELDDAQIFFKVWTALRDSAEAAPHFHMERGGSMVILANLIDTERGWLSAWVTVGSEFIIFSINTQVGERDWSLMDEQVLRLKAALGEELCADSVHSDDDDWRIVDGLYED